MTSFTLSDHQLALIERPIKSKIFLEGPAGTGKTTAGVGRLLHLLAAGVPAGTILVVVPQRTLATPYYKALRRPELAAVGQVTILTKGGLARRNGNCAPGCEGRATRIRGDGEEYHLCALPGCLSR